MNICDICKKATTEHLGRCEEHHRCDKCGTKEDLCHGYGGVFCFNCWCKIIEDKVKNFNERTDFRRELTCPYCGYQPGDDWEIDEEYIEDMICEMCENTFEMTRDVDISYTTRKKEEKN